MRAWLFVVLAGCWTGPSSPAVDSAPAVARSRHVVAKARPRVECEQQLPEDTRDAAAILACANALLDARDYVAADRLAARVQEEFPYSPRAVTAELLHCDVLAASHRYVEADAAYGEWLVRHERYGAATPAQIDYAKQKQLAARLAAGATS